MVASNLDEVGCAPPCPDGTAAAAIASLGRRRFDLLNSRRAADRDASRLHGFRDLAHQVDDQKAILEAGALDLDVVGEGERAPTRPWEIPRCSNRRDPEGIPIAAVATTKKFGRPRKVSRGRRNFFLQGLGSVNPFDPSSSAPALPRARQRGFPRPLSLSTGHLRLAIFP
jgi:hypothetical protein